MGRADSPLRERVIFVEGAPRSGTTWLVTLLATHPEIAGVSAESHLFDFGVDRLFDNLEGRDPDFHGLNSFLDRDELIDLVRDLCDGILVAMRSHVSPAALPAFVVEKTPIRGRVEPLDLERKRDCYPDAHYLHIVRDREAVAQSLMRAPWMWERSYAACTALWDRTVGYARSILGDLPHYREISYEELRGDPAEGCRALFEWLGVRADEEVLETIRVLSREQFSDVSAAPDIPSRSLTIRTAEASRRIASMARAALKGQWRSSVPDGQPDGPGSALSFRFARALRERDAETLVSLTDPTFEFVFRSPAGDLSLRGDEARAALVRTAEQTFNRRYVGEWWASPGGGPGEWWTATAGKLLCTLTFSALGGDATRVDLAFALLVDNDVVSRATVISAGSLAGRPVVAETADDLHDNSAAGRGRR